MLKLQFKDNPARGFWLVGEQLTLGTGSECNVVLEGLGINPLHATITITGDAIELSPSENSPCYVNANAVGGHHKLQEGDEIRIGKERLLIVDPKQQTQALEQNEKPNTAKNKKVWTLVAEHPKLKDRPFLVTDKSVLGRSKHVNLFIPFKHLSREHAELTVAGDVLHLKDLGSSNGCFVNGERVQEYDLKGGETVSFAFLDFKVNSPVAATPKPDPGSDVTQIRSAITEEDIARAVADDEPQNQSLDLSEINEPVEQPVKTDKPNYLVWGGIAVILLAAVLYGWLNYAA